MVSRVLRGTLNWAPMMPKDAILSDSRGKFFQSGLTNYLFISQPNETISSAGLGNNCTNLCNQANFGLYLQYNSKIYTNWFNQANF